ncbi:unnamed protein product [Sphagnum jensenii]|uniref:Uncharacterized protein n=1 Tax=Sphagnum jensenii TaxID=128206 RepID=A0ABP0VC68_9BRYO
MGLQGFEIGFLGIDHKGQWDGDAKAFERLFSDFYFRDLRIAVHAGEGFLPAAMFSGHFAPTYPLVRPVCLKEGRL